MLQDSAAVRPLTNAEKLRGLPWAWAANVANMPYCYLAFFGPVFVLFLSQLGMSKMQIGLVLAVIQFTSIIAPFAAGPVSRVGLKRVVVWTWGVRTLMLAPMIAAPWVLERYGTQSTFLFVMSVMLVFSLLRSVAMTALMPWSQDYIPAPVRGKFTALQNIGLVVSGAATLALAGAYLGKQPALSQFSWLYVVGLGLGLLTTWCFSRVPGGEASTPGRGEVTDLRAMLQTLRDRRFMLFLAVSTLMNLGWTPLASFLPLYYEGPVGLAKDQVVLLESIRLGAGLLSWFLWGWAADRYGAKPVMLVSLALLGLHPLGLWLLPRHEAVSYPLAVALTVGVGLVAPGWAVGYGRMQMVEVIPASHKTAYNAVHTAWILGIVTGLTPMLGGQVLEWGEGSLSPAWWGPLAIDAYTPLIVLALVGVASAVVLLGMLPAREGLSVRQFVGLFAGGNPMGTLYTLYALVAYQFAGPETERVAATERLARARSPLSVLELAEALHDPSFNVRYEAIISIARTRTDPALTAALVGVLESQEPDLSIAAAWALGRLGDPAAIVPLRRALDSSYPLLRARTARALGTLGDQASAEVLLRRLEDEKDIGECVAYAAALGQLRHRPALEPILRFLGRLRDPGARVETALAAATLLGREQRFVRLWQRLQQHGGDALAVVLLQLKSRLSRDDPTEMDLAGQLEESAHHFGTDDLAGGTHLLDRLVGRVPRPWLRHAAAVVLTHTRQQILDDDQPRLEVVVLALHALTTGLKGRKRRAGTS